MKVCMIGTGYVGLVSGVCFAEMGNDVICVDKDKTRIEMLVNGKVPIYEPHLGDLLKRNLKEGRIKFTSNLKEACEKSLFIFIAVGTPCKNDGSCDLNDVFGVAEEIGNYINEYKIIATKSTVPVGTAERIREIIKAKTKVEFDVASNPEFLKEGAAVEDFMRPDRVVIGTDSQKVKELMGELYSAFLRKQDRVVFMSNRSAEMVKYASNCFLATRISFINEMANLCERMGADVSQVREGMGSDSRIGYKFLFPGVGYGGSCFPKDVKALIYQAAEHNYDYALLRAVESVNTRQKLILFYKIKNHFEGALKGKTIAIWGLSFKPDTDDIRDAPSITIIESLLREGAKINAYDPGALKTAKAVLGDKIKYFEHAYEALKDADALAVITEWREFRAPDFDKIANTLKSNVIFDGRNIYNPEELKKLGFSYYGVGR